ncbi:hypothetical protein OG884_12815 [Streptosporangium sp. NBC_01755]|uniref:hypothetical protein n=1 Tax=unclassified Streptosporangium TaxID=2632669 RepID=UPI002DDBA11F|nr:MULTISPECIES: hypothetical protein [unclassified Streptosporangium]WSA25872.1 hypothetical protein OIE13_34040 [Streptosporangium sp. NBC_01810]WSD02735.1 hypothetical protein OG884_12815 [Streptosporangium sp. NBC_01755]
MGYQATRRDVARGLAPLGRRLPGPQPEVSAQRGPGQRVPGQSRAAGNVAQPLQDLRHRRDDRGRAVTVGLITDMPVTPQVRGAAFRMLADLETIEVVRDVVDAEGRTGSAVAIEERVRAKADAKGGEGILRNRLIFDEATGRALARDSVVVRPGGLQAGFAPGTVWHSQTILEAGWTDEKPAS